MISANGGLAAHRYTPQVTLRWPRGSEPASGQDRSRWNRLEPRFNKNRKEPRRIGSPPLSFREYRSQHDGCWVCYGKGNNHAHDHRHCKVYEHDRKTYFADRPDKKPKEQQIADWKAKDGDGGKGQGKGQAKGGGKAMVEDPAQTDA